MKKIYLLFLVLFITGIGFAQPLNKKAAPATKIKLTNGQVIRVETTTDIEASLSIGGDLVSNSTMVNALEVKNSTKDEYTIANTLTRLKTTSAMMGQALNYDSENKEGNSTEIESIMNERMNKPVEVVINANTGITVMVKDKDTKMNTDETNTANDLMKMFSDNSDDALVSMAFQTIPAGIKNGDSWADTSKAKDMKTIRTYTLKSVSGNESTIDARVVSTAKNKLEFMEMEFEIKTETNSTSEIIVDTQTGQVKKRTTSSDISGSFQVMGQDTPITAKTTSVSIYK